MLSYFKKIVKILIIALVICLIFRSFLYRKFVSYKPVKARFSYTITENKIKIYVEENYKEQNINEIIDRSLSLTTEHLNFTSSKNYNNPNKLMFTKTANCIGYASFFSTICNYLINVNSLNQEWEAIPYAGELYFFGVNINHYFQSPFLKDHDFVIIRNKITNKKFVVDPSLSDYFYIDYVTIKN